MLDSWTGELYLEYHRGTYTTQAKTKKNNRLLERELQAAEALYSCLPLATYPASQLDSVIKTLLLLQFHDIIPGSSIHKVYEDAELLYEKAFATLYELRSKAQKSLFYK
ncbi:hypothetical protein MASR2M78_20310 [Treponema sp.]